MAIENYTVKTTVNEKGEEKRTFTVGRVKAVYDKAAKVYTQLEEGGYTIQSIKQDADGNGMVAIRVSTVWLYLTEDKESKIHISSKPFDFTKRCTEGWGQFKSDQKTAGFKNAKKYLLQLEGFKDLMWVDFIDFAKEQYAMILRNKAAEAKAKAEAKAAQEERTKQAMGLAIAQALVG